MRILSNTMDCRVDVPKLTGSRRVLPFNIGVPNVKPAEMWTLMLVEFGDIHAVLRRHQILNRMMVPLIDWYFSVGLLPPNSNRTFIGLIKLWTFSVERIDLKERTKLGVCMALCRKDMEYMLKLRGTFGLNIDMMPPVWATGRVKCPTRPLGVL